MVQVNINFSNKTFYTLVAIISVLIISGVVYAYNSQSTPAVMGHSINEIENFNASVLTIVNEALGSLVCDSPPILDSGTTAVPGYVSITMPDSCRSTDGCVIVQEIYQKSGSSDILFTRKQVFYGQTVGGTAEIWWSTDSPSGGYRNGDSKYSKITLYTNNNQGLYDDYKSGTYSETSKDQWTARDSSNIYGQKIYVC